MSEMKRAAIEKPNRPQQNQPEEQKKSPHTKMKNDHQSISM